MRISIFSYFRFFLTALFILIGFSLLVWDVLFSLDIPDQERTLWIVDISSSMGIEDISTNNPNVMMSRLDLAKSIMSVSFSGETAIMTYARHANMILPFTQDIEQARLYTA